jgi:hypothetical protein
MLLYLYYSNSETYYCAPAELLKPEDLLAFEESGIDDDISSNSSSEVGTISEYVEADHRLGKSQIYKSPCNTRTF